MLEAHPRRRSLALRGNFFYGLVAFAALAFLPFAEIHNLTVQQGTLIAYLFVLWSAFRLAALIARGAAHLLDAAFYTFCYSFLSLPLLAQVNSGQYALGTAYSYTPATVTTSELILLVGFVAYEIGRRFHHHRHRDDDGTPVQRGRGISGAAALVVGYIGLGFVALAVLRYGLATFFTSRDALTQAFLGPAAEGVKFYLNQNKAAGATLQQLTQIPVFIGAYLALYLRRAAKNDPTIKAPGRWWVVPLVIGNVIVNNPIGNARFWWVTVVFAFASIYMPLTTRKGAARLFVVAFVVTTLFSFQQLAAFRRTTAIDRLSAEPLSQQLLDDPDYASPQQILNGVEYVRASGLTDGKQLAGTVFVWVPRSLWPTKPDDTGQVVDAAAGFNVSAPIWTEGYVDWGIAGVAAYLFLIGYLASGLDRRFVNARAPNMMAAFAPVMASLLVFIVRGSLQPAFGSTLPVIGCVLLCVRWRVGKRAASLPAAVSRIAPRSTVPAQVD